MRIRNYAISLLSMVAVSVISLITLGILTYNLKWKADTAMIGITITYIVAGFVGGVTLKLARLWQGRRKKESDVYVQKENQNISSKMLEAIFVATIFMGILLLLSLVWVQGGFEMSGRFLTIWMLLLGSACLGRIL